MLPWCDIFLLCQKNAVGHMYRMHIGVKVQNQITPSSDMEHTSASASYMRNNLHRVMYIKHQLPRRP